MPVNLELRHMRQFVCLAEELNFSRAARRLNISQPALSQQMKVLEGVLGVSLLDRSKRSVNLTSAGTEFLAEARRVLDQVERSVLAAKRAESGELGKIVIGYTASAAYSGILSSTVAAFHRRYPLVTLTLHSLVTSAQIGQLGLGRIDIAFLRSTREIPKEIETVTLLREPVILALPGDHPAARRKAVKLAALSEETFIVPNAESGVSFNEHTQTLCREAGFAPQTASLGRDFVAVASMVSVGMGVSIVPSSLRCLQIPNVAYREITGVSKLTELGVAFRREETNGAVLAFIRHARSVALPR